MPDAGTFVAEVPLFEAALVAVLVFVFGVLVWLSATLLLCIVIQMAGL